MIFVYNDNNTKISEISDIIKQRSERERERELEFRLLYNYFEYNKIIIIWFFII